MPDQVLNNYEIYLKQRGLMRENKELEIGGLAFGLGGQNAARSFLDKLRDEISDR